MLCVCSAVVSVPRPFFFFLIILKTSGMYPWLPAAVPWHPCNPCLLECCVRCVSVRIRACRVKPNLTLLSQIPITMRCLPPLYKSTYPFKLKPTAPKSQQQLSTYRTYRPSNSTRTYHPNPKSWPHTQLLPKTHRGSRLAAAAADTACSVVWAARGQSAVKRREVGSLGMKEKRKRDETALPYLPSHDPNDAWAPTTLTFQPSAPRVRKKGHKHVWNTSLATSTLDAPNWA